MILFARPAGRCTLGSACGAPNAEYAVCSLAVHSPILLSQTSHSQKRFVKKFMHSKRKFNLELFYQRSNVVLLILILLMLLIFMFFTFNCQIVPDGKG